MVGMKTVTMIGMMGVDVFVRMVWVIVLVT